MFKYLLIYYLAINAIGAFVNICDKIKAKHNKWRIKEATLWAIGIVGGATGSYITMQIIRHKTKHKIFMIGMPILAILQIGALLYLTTILN